MKVETKLALILSAICAFFNAMAISDAEKDIAPVLQENQVIRTKMSSLVSQGKNPSVGKMGISALLGEAELLKDFATFMKETMAELVNLKQEIISTKEQLRSEIAAQGKSLTNKIVNQGITLTNKIEAQGSALRNKIEVQGRTLTIKIEAQGNALTKKIEDQGNALTNKIKNQGSTLTNKINSQADLISALQQSLVSQISTVKDAVNADIESLKSNAYHCEMGHIKLSGYGKKSVTFKKSFKEIPQCEAGIRDFKAGGGGLRWPYGVSSLSPTKTGLKIKIVHTSLHTTPFWICCGN